VAAALPLLFDKRSQLSWGVRERPGIQTLKYITVFDVARDGFAAWWGSAVGAALIVVGAAALLYLRKQIGPKARLQKMFMVVWTGFAVVWTFTVYSATHAEFTRVRDALASHKFVIVEGAITNFKPAPSGGHADEEFDVSGRHYSFSDYVVVAGYHRSQSHGGAIREGLRVRIADIDGQIARLDTASSITTPLPNER